MFRPEILKKYTYLKSQVQVIFVPHLKIWVLLLKIDRANWFRAAGGALCLSLLVFLASGHSDPPPCGTKPISAIDF